jgi:hypothetical protein
MLVHHIGIAAEDYETSDLYRACVHAGVRGYADFVTLTEADINSFVVPSETDERITAPLPPVQKRMLVIALAMFHDASRINKKPIKITSVSTANFNAYRINQYNSGIPIIPWSQARPDPVNQELANWKKQVRPSRSDYRDLKDDISWIRHKEHLLTTLEAHGLSHIVQADFIPTDNETDKAQMVWLYKVFQDTLKAPTARTIVTKYLDTKDTRALWKELCEKLDSSMTAELHAQKISTYLSSTRLHQINWRGSQESFLLNFKENARLHNEINPQDKYSDPQLIRFLNACVAQTSNLATVLENHRTSLRAAGKGTDSLTFDEYVGLLQLQAQVYDSGRVNTTNPRVKRSVNMAQYTFDDGDDLQDDGYEVNSHDFDTPIDDILAMSHEVYTMQSNNRPRKVMMNKETWTSLSPQAQVAWDTISDKDKSIILGYVAKRDGKTNANLHQAKPVDAQRNGIPANRSINSHEVSTDNDGHHPSMEVGVHETREGTLIDLESNPKPSLLTMATTRTTQADLVARRFDINHMLSQAVKPITKNITVRNVAVNNSKTVDTNEVREANTTFSQRKGSAQYFERSGLEAHVHERSSFWNKFKEELEDDDDDDDDDDVPDAKKPAIPATDTKSSKPVTKPDSGPYAPWSPRFTFEDDDDLLAIEETIPEPEEKMKGKFHKVSKPTSTLKNRLTEIQGNGLEDLEFDDEVEEKVEISEQDEDGDPMGDFNELRDKNDKTTADLVGVFAEGYETDSDYEVEVTKDIPEDHGEDMNLKMEAMTLSEKSDEKDTDIAFAEPGEVELRDVKNTGPTTKPRQQSRYDLRKIPLPTKEELITDRGILEEERFDKVVRRSKNKNKKSRGVLTKVARKVYRAFSPTSKLESASSGESADTRGSGNSKKSHASQSDSKSVNSGNRFSALMHEQDFQKGESD